MFEYKRVQWALRKSSLPVADNGLVLDVGSGGTPYPRSDVLLDRLTGSDHRCGDSMMIDRPTVFGDAQKMPFKDKSFDFIVASHILEHISQPEKFILELQRVGRAGYIETPNAIFERLFPYDIHCLEVMLVDGTLHIHKKGKPLEDPFLGTLGFLSKDSKWKRFFFERLDMFHVRFFWESDIKFKIYNPEVSCEWIEQINSISSEGGEKQSYLQSELGWRKYGLSILNRWHSFRRKRRLKDFNLNDILCCPECHGKLIFHKKNISCNACNVAFKKELLPDFTKAIT